MRRPGVVLRRQPVIKPGVSGLRLIGTVELAVAMPLASHTGRVAGLLKKLRQSQFRTPQVNLLTSIRSRFGGCRNPVVHSRSIRRTTGHQTNSGRRTDGRRRIEIREANSFPSEPVDVLRPDVRMTVDSDNVAKPRPMCHATPWRDSRHGVAAHNFARTLRSCATATRWYRKQPVANHIQMTQAARPRHAGTWLHCRTLIPPHTLWPASPARSQSALHSCRCRGQFRHWRCSFRSFPLPSR